MLFRKEMLDKIGILDERYYMYYEEPDISRRAKQAGYKIIILLTQR